MDGCGQTSAGPLFMFQCESESHRRVIFTYYEVNELHYITEVTWVMFVCL